MSSVIFGPEYEVLPNLMSELRIRNGLTHRELGRRMRRSPSHIHRIENRQRRVEVVEFCNFVTACGGDPVEVLQALLARIGRAGSEMETAAIAVAPKPVECAKAAGAPGAPAFR